MEGHLHITEILYIHDDMPSKNSILPIGNSINIKDTRSKSDQKLLLSIKLQNDRFINCTQSVHREA